MYGRNSSPQPATPSINVEPASPYGNRRGPSSVPAHMQGYAPSTHQRRSSVVDLAADMMGPQGAEALGSIRKLTSKTEDIIDGFARPLRPYLPGLGRFLIVVTFLEDALRILTQITGSWRFPFVFSTIY